MEVGLDLTKTRVKKFDELDIIKESSFVYEKIKNSKIEIGLDLTNRPVEVKKKVNKNEKN
jgi:hypothetical protein